MSPGTERTREKRCKQEAEEGREERKEKDEVKEEKTEPHTRGEEKKMSFWIRFGVVLGSLLDPLGRPNRAKIGPRRPKFTPRGPKITPRPVKISIFMKKNVCSTSIGKQPKEKQ